MHSDFYENPSDEIISLREEVSRLRRAVDLDEVNTLKKLVLLLLDECDELTEKVEQLERENKDLLEERELNDCLRDKVQQLEAQVPRWVSVEERLPGDREDTVGEVVNVMVDKSGVICSTSGYYDWQAEGWYIYDGTMAAYRTSLYGWIVVAWMPLPEALKEG